MILSTDVTLEKLKAFIPDFLGQMHIECLIAGNLTKEVCLVFHKV